jgi:hypothetical protein
VILKLPFTEFELDNVISESFKEGLMDRGEVPSAEETAFEAGVFVCLGHLLKSGSRQKVEK